MLDDLIPIVSVLSTFSWLIIWVYMFYSSRMKVRMALIESGRSADIFRSKDNRENALKYGILGIMLGLGLLLGELLHTALGITEEIAYFSMILLMGGMGLLGFYSYMSRKQQPEKEYDSEVL